MVMSHATYTKNRSRSDDLVVVERLKVYYRSSASFIENLFGRGSYIRAVDGVDLVIRRDEALGLVGESGSGKTTLGKAILRLVDISSGRVLFDGEDVYSLRGKKLKLFRMRAQLIFQDPYTSLNPRIRIGDQVKEPLEIHGIGSNEERVKAAIDMLRRVGLSPPEEYYRRYPHQLSGGQRQRVAIARALITKPELVVADEPVASLDVSARAQILMLMRELKRDLGLSYLIITHDFSVAWELCDRIAVMYLGKIVEEGAKRDIFENPLHPYTQALIAAIPKIDPTNSRARTGKIRIIGEIPPSRDIPQGCRFHNRCPLAMDICRSREPLLIEIERGHKVACHLYTDA